MHLHVYSKMSYDAVLCYLLAMDVLMKISDFYSTQRCPSKLSWIFHQLAAYASTDAACQQLITSI